MGKESELYLCEVCGQMVRVVKGGPGALFCCGQPMRRLSSEQAANLGEKK